MPSLHFKGKSAVETYHHTVPHHTLQFVKKLSVLDKGQEPSLDGNLIIEGDNLLALKALLPTHAGKIKCVYIDPPYNTGNEGWVYNDNLTQPQFKEWIGQTVGKEGEDFCRHDKWCCMMYPRLQLLRELMRDDGVLFMSIGEDEIGNLRMIADEIFRTTIPLITFVWKRRSASGMRGDAVSVDHEYVLGYAKDPSLVRLNGLVKDESDYKYEDDRGRYASTDLTIGMGEDERPNQAYVLVNPRTGAKYPHNPDRVWTFEPDSMKAAIKAGMIIWPEDNPDSRMTRPRQKTYFDPKNPQVRPVSSWIESLGNSEPREDEEGVVSISSGLNTEGGRALKKALGKKLFDYPKPPSLITSLVQIATSSDDLVLDSFAGSGTTAEAVLKANERDRASRRFLLVQMPYDSKEHERSGFNVCESVTAPRAKASGASFTYARVSSKPLFGDYRDLGDQLPSYDDIAAYVFYTETSTEWKGSDRRQNKAFDKGTRKIGEHGGRSYYLLYEPNDRLDGGVDATFLKNVAAKDPNPHIVVYAEKVWVHRDQLRAWEHEHGKFIRPMIVPFNLK